jgi:hypothetical protein
MILGFGVIGPQTVKLSDLLVLVVINFDYYLIILLLIHLHLVKLYLSMNP